MSAQTERAAPARPGNGSGIAAHHDQQHKATPGDGVAQGGVVGTIERNSRERIHVALSSFKGNVYLDVRTFAIYPEGDRPTKGITIRPAQIPALREILERAEGEARARGLL